MTIERKDSRNSDKPRHYCRNLHCRSKLKAPVENERDAFCTRGCFEIFYRTRCRVCERRLDADPMTGGKRVADGRRRFCGRKCASKARIDPRGTEIAPRANVTQEVPIWRPSKRPSALTEPAY
jgi:hypothetical protein